MSTKHENIVGLYVTNDDLYSTYRQKMIPILESYGGGFRYDFQIAEVLTNDSDVPINRLFAIYFDDKEKNGTVLCRSGLCSRPQPVLRTGGRRRHGDCVL